MKEAATLVLGTIIFGTAFLFSLAIRAAPIVLAFAVIYWLFF